MSRGARRPRAGRDEIIMAARRIGAHEGWKAVTIRSVAQELGYASPLLYEHFKNKEDLLTQVAVQGLVELEAALTQSLPADAGSRVAVMVERNWRFMLEHTYLYRLMNGMDGDPIDKQAMGKFAESICKAVADAVLPLLGSESTLAHARVLADELWALLHGMAALYLDRAAPFTVEGAVAACTKLIRGSQAEFRASRVSS